VSIVTQVNLSFQFWITLVYGACVLMLFIPNYIGVPNQSLAVSIKYTYGSYSIYVP